MPDQMKIEMVSVDPERSDGSEAATVTSATSQRRGLAVAAIVGAAGLVLGWLIGHSTGSDRVDTTPGTTSEATEAAATTVPEESLADAPLPPPRTTRPLRATTTTTTLAPSAFEVVEIDSRLTGAELTLVGVNPKGIGLPDELVELDLARQTLSRSDLGHLHSFDRILAGEDWTLVIGGKWVSLVRDGESPQIVDLGEPGDLLWQQGTDRFWRPVQRETQDDTSVYEEVNLAGEPTGRTIELPPNSRVQLSDPRGGLVVKVYGRSYSINEQGASLIGSGELIALSSDVAVLQDCDDQLQCGLSIVHRVTGAVRQLDTDLPSEGLRPMWSWGWGGWGLGGAISPDGEVTAALMTEGDPGESIERLVFIDLQSGAITLSPNVWVLGVVWSPDARFAFYVDHEPFDTIGELVAYDRESGEVFPIFAEPIEWATLAARPSSHGAALIQ